MSTFPSPKDIIQLAHVNQDSHSLWLVNLVSNFCTRYGQVKYFEIVQKIASEGYEGTNALEHELRNALSSHLPQFMLELGELLHAATEGTVGGPMCGFDVVQLSEVVQPRSGANALAPIFKDPTIAPPLPPGKPSSPVQSIVCNRTVASSSRTRFSDCAKFTIRSAIKRCPFCSTQFTGYKMKEHIQACREYRGNYGSTDDPAVVNYINKVCTHVHCSGCGRWFEGFFKALQHNSKKTRHAQNFDNEITHNTAVWQSSTFDGLSMSYNHRRPTDLATTGFFEQHPTANDLQGNHAFASIDAAAQEASDYPSGSGQHRYPVAFIPNFDNTLHYDDANSMQALQTDQMISDFDTPELKSVNKQTDLLLNALTRQGQ